MDLTNKQDLADLLFYVDGYNATEIELPPPSGRKNSENDNWVYSLTWYDQFWEVYNNNKDDFYSIKIDGAALYGTNITIDGIAAALVILNIDTCEFDGFLNGCILDTENIKDTGDLIRIWLGDTSLDEHEHHCIQEFAEKIGYEE